MTSDYDLDPTLTREDDWETSIAAAKKVKDKLSKTMKAVYSVLSHYPMGLTDCELRKAMVQHGFPPRAESTYRKRRTDLMQMGYVIPTGVRRENDSGGQECVWAVSSFKKPDLQ